MGHTSSSLRADAKHPKRITVQVKQIDHKRQEEKGDSWRDEKQSLDLIDLSGSETTSRHVGLQNNAGDNNCFLNATIQALWHLNLFREKILYTDSNFSSDDNNIDLIFSAEDDSADTLSAICSLFAQYQFTEDMCIPSTEIRYILSQLDESGRFGLGDIADAAETLDALLNHIHTGHVSKLCAIPGSQLHPNQKDFCHSGQTKCVSHVIFGGVFVSQSTCRTCRATNEPAIIEPFLHYASVMALLSEKASGHPGLSFGRLLNLAFRNAAVECPSLENLRPHSVNANGRSRGAAQTCSGRAEINMSCLEAPAVLAVSLAWPSDNAPAELIQQFLSVLDGNIWLSEVFHSAPAGNAPSAPLCPTQQSNQSEKYIFRGFVCFYGMHYISIFQEWNPNTQNSEFLLFDDAHIRRIGKWQNVVKECIRARYQPVLLLYEKQAHAPPVSSY